MSTYSRLTKNPDTGEWEQAIWIDDYYAKNHYGVKFENGIVVDPEIIELETKNMDKEEQIKWAKNEIKEYEKFIKMLEEK